MADNIAGEIESDKDINGSADLLEGAAVNSIVLSAKVMFAARADFYENLAKVAYSKFGAANAGVISAAERKTLQSYYSKLSKTYRAAANNSTKTLSLLKTATTNFKIMGHQIPSKLGGVPLNANPLAVILAVADVGIGEIDRAQMQARYPNVDLSASTFDITTKLGKSLLNGLTFGLFAVEGFVFEVHATMPFGKTRKEQWLREMEGYASDWTNQARAAAGNPDIVPAGILQYLKIRQASSAKLLTTFGIASGNDEFSWINDWSLVKNGSSMVAVRNNAQTPKFIYTDYLPYPAQTGLIEIEINEEPYFLGAANDLANELKAETFIAPTGAPDNDDVPYLGYIAAKQQGATSLITNNLCTGAEGGGDAPAGSRGEGRLVRGSVNTLYSDGIAPDIQVTVNAASRGAYAYTDWGEWNGAGKGIRNLAGAPVEGNGLWVIGQSTRADQMPRTGGASFAGEVAALGFNGEQLGGGVQLHANFGNGSMSGQLNIRRANGDPWVNAFTGTMLFDEYSHEVLYSAQDMRISSPGSSTIATASGNIDGRFYGPNAEETAGSFAIWGVPDDVGGIDGVFRAKQ